MEQPTPGLHKVAVKQPLELSQYQKTVRASVDRLHKFFEIKPEIFYDLPMSKQELIDWAAEIRLPNYQLTHKQHNVLIGRYM